MARANNRGDATRRDENRCWRLAQTRYERRRAQHDVIGVRRPRGAARAIRRCTMEILRTPDDRFHGLSGYPFVPQYVDVAGLRIHYLDEGPAEAAPILL